MLETLWVGLAGVIVFLDTTAVAQTMICQPLIACPLWGIFVGRPEIGLFFGVVFQLLWLGSLPVGASKFPEGNLGALIATALAARVPAQSDGEPAWLIITAAALAGLLSAHLGKELTPLVRRIMNGIAPKIIQAAETGNQKKFNLYFLQALSIHVFGGFLFTILCFTGGKWLLSLYAGDFAAAGVSEGIVSATDELLKGVWPAMLGAGAAVLAHRLVTKKSLPLFAITALASLGLGWIWIN